MGPDPVPAEISALVAEPVVTDTLQLKVVDDTVSSGVKVAVPPEHKSCVRSAVGLEISGSGYTVITKSTGVPEQPPALAVTL